MAGLERGTRLRSTRRTLLSARAQSKQDSGTFVDAAVRVSDQVETRLLLQALVVDFVSKAWQANTSRRKLTMNPVSHRARLSLESLEARETPAGIVDVTFARGSVTMVG